MEGWWSITPAGEWEPEPVLQTGCGLPCQQWMDSAVCLNALTSWPAMKNNIMNMAGVAVK